MIDVAEKAGLAAELLDGLHARLEDFLAGYDKLEASGSLTPEIEAQVSDLVERARVYMLVIRESVAPTLAPMLWLRRVAKAKARAMFAAGDSEDFIRAAFADLISRKSSSLPEDQRAQVGPMIDRAISEVLLEAQPG